jgi:hypothetical protein
VPPLLRGTDPHWVAPLRTEQARLLDRGRHPFYVNRKGAAADQYVDQRAIMTLLDALSA